MDSVYAYPFRIPLWKPYSYSAALYPQLRILSQPPVYKKGIEVNRHVPYRDSTLTLLQLCCKFERAGAAQDISLFDLFVFPSGTSLNPLVQPWGCEIACLATASPLWCAQFVAARLNARLLDLFNLLFVKCECKNRHDKTNMVETWNALKLLELSDREPKVTSKGWSLYIMRQIGVDFRGLVHWYALVCSFSWRCIGASWTLRSYLLKMQQCTQALFSTRCRLWALCDLQIEQLEETTSADRPCLNRCFEQIRMQQFRNASRSVFIFNIICRRSQSWLQADGLPVNYTAPVSPHLAPRG